MLKKLSVAMITVTCASACASAQLSLNKIPSYVPSEQVSGVIRNYGSALSGMVKEWEDDFVKHQPGISFKDDFPAAMRRSPVWIQRSTILLRMAARPR